MTIQYDGSDFHGWQVQAHERTVQGDIETALTVIYPKEKINLIGAGRTDTGVHAWAQVAHVELPDRLSAPQLCQALNGNLKRDVRIDSAVEVDNDFHARFSATAREYEYHLVKKNSPITRKYATELTWDINTECGDGYVLLWAVCYSISETDTLNLYNNELTNEICKLLFLTCFRNSCQGFACFSLLHSIQLGTTFPQACRPRDFLLVGIK